MKTIQLQLKTMPEQFTLDTDGTEEARRATGVPSVSGISLPPDLEVCFLLKASEYNSYPYPGAVKGIGLEKISIQLGCHSGKGQSSIK